MQGSNRTHSLWRFFLLAALGGAVLFWLAWRSRGDLLTVLRSVSPYWITLSAISGVLLNIMYGLLLNRMMWKYEEKSNPALYVAVYLMSQPGKYLPGKLWQIVMQSIALRGKSRAGSIGIANIELSLAAVAHATGLGLLCLASPQLIPMIAIAVLTFAASYVLLRFRTIHPLLAAIPRFRGWVETTSPPTLQSKNILPPLAITAAAMLLNFTASWWLLKAAHLHLNAWQASHLLASLWLGIAGSLLALPIPAGLGIREALIAGIGDVLAPEISSTILISIALLARCWQLLIDAISVFVGWILWHLVRHSRAYRL